ncbi:MAG TPA: class I SAM-dependent methyltransferase [Candidatus Sulfotelmatobacter sp.]|nr:class I SAM-dependent methyltransferase [Candidatus Sulfotelmatobacter sp.]
MPQDALKRQDESSRHTSQLLDLLLRDVPNRDFAVGPGGLFLCSGIGIPASRAQSDEPVFTDVYVFPDGELAPISTTLSNAENAGFEVHEVENWRQHYALTTQHWLRRLESHATEAREIVGEERYRIWRLYLAGSNYYFQKSWLDLYQTLLRKNSSAQ